jgi:hypothetical protein
MQKYRTFNELLTIIMFISKLRQAKLHDVLIKVNIFIIIEIIV